MGALAELYTKCWLINQGRFVDLMDYVQTHNSNFDEEASLIIDKLMHNSPADINLNTGFSPKEIAEALKTGIDGITQASLRREEAELENKAKILDLKLKEETAKLEFAKEEQILELDIQRAELERKEKQLELQAKQLELQEKRLEIEKKRIDYALETASKMVDILCSGVDVGKKEMLMRTLLPSLLQLGRGKGLELALPPPQNEEEVE